jgi:hypothetical protein
LDGFLGRGLSVERKTVKAFNRTFNSLNHQFSSSCRNVNTKMSFLVSYIGRIRISAEPADPTTLFSAN